MEYLKDSQILILYLFEQTEKKLLLQNVVPQYHSCMIFKNG